MFLRSAICASLLFFQTAISLAYEYFPPNAISGRVSDDIQPKDVCARASWLEKEIKLIDFDQKLTSKNTIPAYKVSNAKPYEVNFIAKSVLNKSQRLCFTYTKSLGGKTPKSRLFHDQPINVFRLLNQSMISVQFVKQAGNIDILLEEEPVSDATPSDVYNKLLTNSRMLSNLNTNKIKPADVLEIVDRAFDIAVALQESLKKDTSRSNTQPVHKADLQGKTPANVFYNMVSLFQVIEDYADEHFSRQLLQLEPVKVDREIEPSDVIDLASLLLAELSYLADSASLFIPENTTPSGEIKGEITPSTVFNRVNKIHGILGYN